MKHATAIAPTIGLALLLLWAAACGHGAQACAVVDAASKLCTVVRYLGPDGQVHEVRVSQSELAAFGQEMATRRAGEAP